MFARIRKSMKEEQGFTLIELLVVMIIIGILAAIAIPVFLNQRKSAIDSSMKSDLRSAATMVETYFVDNQEYPAALTDITEGLSKDENTDIEFTLDADNAAYCLVATRTEDSQPGSRDSWSYDSNDGGLMDAGDDCVVAATPPAS